MKTLAAALLTVFFAAAGAARARDVHLEKLWENTDVTTPESVAWDAQHRVFYASSVNGPVMKKDGNGYISKIGPDGHTITRDWITGLDGPKGLVISGGKLYVADIDTLVEIDIKDARILHRYPAAGAKFLNDTAAGPDGAIYVSDSFTQTIYRLHDGRLEAWLTDPALNGPNGLLVQDGRLLVASMGTGQPPTPPASLHAVSLADQSISTISKDLGHLDGLQADGDRGWFLTDWPAGKLLYVDRDGQSRELLTVSQGTADLDYVPSRHLLVIPVMMSNKLVAYQLVTGHK